MPLSAFLHKESSVIYFFSFLADLSHFLSLLFRKDREAMLIGKKTVFSPLSERGGISRILDHLLSVCGRYRLAGGTRGPNTLMTPQKELKFFGTTSTCFCIFFNLNSTLYLCHRLGALRRPSLPHFFVFCIIS